MHRKHLIIDTFGATTMVFVVMALFAYIPFNFKILDPLKQGLKDFEFSDIYFSKIKTKADVDTNIILVNIGNNNRFAIAEQLRIIKQHQPAVIGMDVQFRTKKDPIVDAMLQEEIMGASNIVMASYLTGPDKSGKGIFSGTDTSIIASSAWGYINFIAKDSVTPIRYFKPDYTFTKTPHDAFSVTIVKKYRPEAYEQLKQRGKPVEIINYSRRQDQYHVIDVNELFDTAADFSFLKGKIVLMGFLGPDLKTRVLEDNYFTPMNYKYSGKSFPDMYGVVIHANIISSVLEGRYINKVPQWLSILIAYVICWLHVFFFIKYYIQHHKFFHLATKIVQLLMFSLMVYGSFVMLSQFGLMISMAPILGAIALSVDVLYFYDGFAVWAKEKFGYKTVFGHH